MEHKEALQLLKDSGLLASVRVDLAELYLEDCEEHSISTALEKLEQGIKDAKAEEEPSRGEG